MRLKIKYITLTLSLIALAGCKENEVLDPIIPESEKSPIELSVGVADGGFATRATRASVVTDCSDNNKKRAFTDVTKLRLVLQSDKDNATPSTHMHTVTLATAATDAAYKTDGVPNNGTTSAVTMSPKRYWDDAYARDAAVSIYALAVADNNDASTKFANTKWADATSQLTAGDTKSAWINSEVSSTNTGTDPNIVKGTNITWTIGTTSGDKQIQDANTIKEDDLCFSNNIADYRTTGTDRRLKFNNTVTKKFDKGSLIFYHALSKITIQVFAREGFTTEDSKVVDDFAFTTGNIKMKGFNGSGTFDVKEGKFDSDITQKDFESIACSDPSRSDKLKSVYTLTAYVVPGTNLNPSTDIADALSFVINNNEYKVSMKQLYNAIKDGDNNAVSGVVKSSILDEGTNLKAGVHYHFSFTISKSQIKDIDAQIVDWETVDAVNIVPSNAKVKLALEQRGGPLDRDLNLYRFAETASSITTDITSETDKGYNWSASSYDGPNSYNHTTKTMTNTWYWPDNKTFYHFRASSVAKATTEEGTPDYIPLTAGTSYTDVLWGAPFKELDGSATAANNAKLSYSITKGFDGKGAEEATDPTHQIYPAIGATEDKIHLLLFHMMSDVTINVKTEGTDEEKVQLGNGTDGNCTTIQFKDISTTGKADLGNGCVTANAITDYSFTTHPAPSSSGIITWLNYGAIPQALSSGTKDVVLIITTSDHNQYEVTMKDIWANAVSTNNLSNPYKETKTEGENTLYKIDRWYPGYKYTYTITLKKKGITDIQATILDWETVTASNDNVQIK